MRKLVFFAVLCLALLAFVAMLATAQEEGKQAAGETAEKAVGETAEKAKKECAGHEFVGAKSCAKICHKTQLASWLETGHASGYDKLSDEEKAKPECVTCHITGKLADGTLLEGVQCEACHGAGKTYKSPKIMSKSKWPTDPEAYKKMAIDAGLVYPTEENCKKCHKKEGNPNFKEFNFEESKAKVHAFDE